jgi:hypothetical protein
MHGWRFYAQLKAYPLAHRLNMEVDLQSLFGLHVYGCNHLLRPRNPTPPPHLGSYTRPLLVSQDRRHLLVTPALVLLSYSETVAILMRLNGPCNLAHIISKLSTVLEF